MRGDAREGPILGGRAAPQNVPVCRRCSLFGNKQTKENRPEARTDARDRTREQTKEGQHTSRGARVHRRKDKSKERPNLKVHMRFPQGIQTGPGVSSHRTTAASALGGDADQDGWRRETAQRF